MARENPTWGYDRIQGALENLGVTLSDTTIGGILREHGIEPAPAGIGYNFIEWYVEPDEVRYKE